LTADPCINPLLAEAAKPPPITMGASDTDSSNRQILVRPDEGLFGVCIFALGSFFMVITTCWLAESENGYITAFYRLIY
jgi:hypothetical protein